MERAAGNKATNTKAHGRWIADRSHVSLRKLPRGLSDGACASGVLPGVLLMGASLPACAVGGTPLLQFDGPDVRGQTQKSGCAVWPRTRREDGKAWRNKVRSSDDSRIRGGLCPDFKSWSVAFGSLQGLSGGIGSGCYDQDSDCGVGW